jgi:hypothetical protein
VCSSANIWADEILAEYQASCDGKEIAADFLSTPDNHREKRQTAAGKVRGAAALRAFEEGWNTPGSNSAPNAIDTR